MARIMIFLRNTHDFLKDIRRVKSELYWVKKVWYVLLLASFTIYVVLNFDTLKTQCFICQFDGNCLIFISWIILLIIPLFSSIEGYGIKLNKEREEQEEQTVKIKLLRDEILNENSIPNIRELEESLENIRNIKDKKDE